MTSSHAGSIVKAAGLVSVALALSRVLGYAREALLAARFGATYTTDAYVVAHDIPTTLFASISAALVMVFIPVYRNVLEQDGEQAGWRLVNTVLNASVLLAVVLMALGFVVAPMAVPLLVPGLPEQALNLATALTRTMLPMVLFVAIAGVGAAVLNANRRFTVPSLVGFVNNVAVVAALLLVTGATQIFWVAGAVVLGALLSAAIQLPLLPGLGFRYQLVIDWRNPWLRRILHLIVPVLITTIAVQLQNFVDRYLASRLAEGSISALNYAVRLNSLPYGVIGVAITTVLYPNLAELAARGERAEMRRTMARGLRTLAFVLVPMALAVIVFCQPLVQIVFQRGAFDPDATTATATALRFYAAGILFFGWIDFLNRCLFALQDTVTPMWVAVGMVGLNIGFSLLLVGPLAHGGLALGTSLSAAVGTGLLLLHLRRKLGRMEGSTLVRDLAMTVGTAIAGVAVGYVTSGAVARMVTGSGLVAQALRLGSGLAMVVLVHVTLAILLGNREVAGFTAGLWQRVRRRLPKLG